MKCIIVLATLLAVGLLDASVRVVASNAIIADWVNQVGGDDVTITTLAGPGVDPHHFSPTPKDIARLAKADLIVSFGEDLEPWLANSVTASGANAPLLNLTERLPLLAPGEAFWLTRELPYPNAESQPDCCREDAMAANQAWIKLTQRMPSDSEHDHEHSGAADHDHHQDHNHGEWDPHVWLDPQLALLMVLEVNTALNQLDEGHAADYDRRREQYLAKLIALDEWSQAKIDNIPINRRLLVTYHDNLRYFARRYGLLTPGSILGSVTTEAADPSAKQFQQLIKLIRDLSVPAIFVDATANPRLAEQVAREAGLPPPVVLYTGNLTPSGGPAADYISLMRHNVTAISKALE